MCAKCVTVRVLLTVEFTCECGGTTVCQPAERRGVWRRTSEDRGTDDCCQSEARTHGPGRQGETLSQHVSNTHTGFPFQNTQILFQFHSKTLFQKRVNSVSNYILTIYSPTFYYYDHFFVFSSLTHFLINVILDSDRF